MPKVVRTRDECKTFSDFFQKKSFLSSRDLLGFVKNVISFVLKYFGLRNIIFSTFLVTTTTTSETTTAATTKTLTIFKINNNKKVLQHNSVITTLLSVIALKTTTK